MSKDFNNLDEINQFVLNTGEKILKNKVYDIVKNIEQENIQKEVYDKYRISSNGQKENPYIYKRRMKQGGLIDDKNIVSKINKTFKNEIELEIQNITKGKDNLQGQQIAGLIEYGDGYNRLEYEYKYNRDNTSKQYLQPRPFTYKTKEELKSNEELYKEKIRQEFIKQGLELE